MFASISHNTTFKFHLLITYKTSITKQTLPVELEFDVPLLQQSLSHNSSHQISSPHVDCCHGALRNSVVSMRILVTHVHVYVNGLTEALLRVSIQSSLSSTESAANTCVTVVVPISMVTVPNTYNIYNLIRELLEITSLIQYNNNLQQVTVFLLTVIFY